jgi:hypothetical protein
LTRPGKATAPRWAALLALLLAAARPLLAGPPFQLDDPDVIPYHYFEFYIWGGVTAVPGMIGSAGPAIEFNYSAIHNSMFHFIVPAGTATASGGPTAFGMEDSEFGVQYRFVDETRRRPMIGTFSMLEIPTGNVNRGLGAGGFTWKVPLYALKDFGPWTVDWGGGEAIDVNVPGGKSYPFGGTIVTRNLSKKLILGGELFAHGKQALDPSQRAAAMLDFGGYYTPTADPDFQVMFCYGHSFVGQSETYSYLTLYWTGDLHKRVAALKKHLGF